MQCAFCSRRRRQCKARRLLRIGRNQVRQHINRWRRPRAFTGRARTFDTPIGIFDGQSDVGSALAPGSASYDAATGQYTIHSAGYNIWYTRDEFRFLWKRMSGDVSLAADINFPDPKGYGDRKAVLMIRQSLDDDAKAAMVALHGAGLVHLAWRPERDASVEDIGFRMSRSGGPDAGEPFSNGTIDAKRIGIEKRGDEFALWVSLDGEPMHQFGPPIKLHMDAPFYVGIGFCSHLPDDSGYWGAEQCGAGECGGEGAVGAGERQCEAENPA